MAQNTSNFAPGSNLKALLDQLYDIKFSKHTTLIVVLLSMVYTIYRTQHYLGQEFHLGSLVAWPTSIFIELLVLAAGAVMFGALRNAYIAELKGVDIDRAKIGVGIALVSLTGAFLALLFVAWSDAYLLTQQVGPALMLSLVQITQMLFIVGFITASDLDERERLRVQYRDYLDQEQRAREEEAQRKARQCPHCFIDLTPNNRKRHIESCPARPQA